MRFLNQAGKKNNRHRFKFVFDVGINNEFKDIWKHLFEVNYEL